MKKNFPDRTYVLPKYKTNEKAEGVHVKITVSNLKDEDFIKAAEEYQQKKQAAKSAPAFSPAERERESIWKQPALYLAFDSGAGIVLLGLGIYWLLREKTKGKSR